MITIQLFDGRRVIGQSILLLSDLELCFNEKGHVAIRVKPEVVITTKRKSKGPMSLIFLGRVARAPFVDAVRKGEHVHFINIEVDLENS
jgi:hypothetical protein